MNQKRLELPPPRNGICTPSHLEDSTEKSKTQYKKVLLDISKMNIA